MESNVLVVIILVVLVLIFFGITFCYYKGEDKNKENKKLWGFVSSIEKILNKESISLSHRIDIAKDLCTGTPEISGIVPSAIYRVLDIIGSSIDKEEGNK
jgi:hypothetical protein